MKGSGKRAACGFKPIAAEMAEVLQQLEMQSAYLQMHTLSLPWCFGV